MSYTDGMISNRLDFRSARTERLLLDSGPQVNIVGEAITRDAKVKIVKLKRLLAFSLQQFEARFTYSLDDEKINYVEANDILDTLNVNDRYKNIEEKLEKLEILIYKIWEDEHGDKMMKAYNEITLFFMDRTSKKKISLILKKL